MTCICRDYCDIHLSGLLWHTSLGFIVTYICQDYCDIHMSGLLWHTSVGIIVTHLLGLLWHRTAGIIVTYICQDCCCRQTVCITVRKWTIQTVIAYKLSVLLSQVNTLGYCCVLTLSTIGLCGKKCWNLNYGMNLLDYWCTSTVCIIVEIKLTIIVCQQICMGYCVLKCLKIMWHTIYIQYNVINCFRLWDVNKAYNIIYLSIMSLRWDRDISPMLKQLSEDEKRERDGNVITNKGYLLNYICYYKIFQEW